MNMDAPSPFASLRPSTRATSMARRRVIGGGASRGRGRKVDLSDDRVLQGLIDRHFRTPELRRLAHRVLNYAPHDAQGHSFLSPSSRSGAGGAAPISGLSPASNQKTPSRNHRRKLKVKTTPTSMGRSSSRSSSSPLNLNRRKRGKEKNHPVGSTEAATLRSKMRNRRLHDAKEKEKNSVVSKPKIALTPEEPSADEGEDDQDSNEEEEDEEWGSIEVGALTPMGMLGSNGGGAALQNLAGTFDDDETDANGGDPFEDAQEVSQTSSSGPILLPFRQQNPPPASHDAQGSESEACAKGGPGAPALSMGNMVFDADTQRWVNNAESEEEDFMAGFSDSDEDSNSGADDQDQREGLGSKSSGDCAIKDNSPENKVITPEFIVSKCLAETFRRAESEHAAAYAACFGKGVTPPSLKTGVAPLSTEALREIALHRCLADIRRSHFK